MERIPLVELTSLNQLAKQAGLSPCNITFNALANTGFTGWDIEPKQTASVTVWHSLAYANCVEAIVTDPGNGGVPSFVIGIFSRYPGAEDHVCKGKRRFIVTEGNTQVF